MKEMLDHTPPHRPPPPKKKQKTHTKAAMKKRHTSEPQKHGPNYGMNGG